MKKILISITLMLSVVNLAQATEKTRADVVTELQASKQDGSYDKLHSEFVDFSQVKKVTEKNSNKEITVQKSTKTDLKNYK